MLSCPVPRFLRAACLASALAGLALPAVCAAAAPPPEPPAGLTLAEAVRLAVERAPQLDASRAAVDAATQKWRRAGRLPDPMLAIGVDNLPVIGTDAFDPDADSMTEKTLGLRQDLPARARRVAERTAASRAVELARSEVAAGRLAVARSAANAWISLWAAQREIEAFDALRDQARLAARLARARVAGGAPVVDALAAEAAVLDLDGEAALAEGSAGVARAEFSRWIGPGSGAIAPSAPDFGRAPRPVDAALAALDAHPALRTAAARVASAAAAVDVARAGRHPDWNVSASYGQRAGFSDMLMLEVGVSLPLFARNRQVPDIAARTADQRAALAAEEALRRELTAQVEATYARWDALRRLVAAHVQALGLLHARSAAALASYRTGGDLRAWLDARRDEAAAHRTHAGHLADLGRAWVDLAYLFEEPIP